MIKRLLSKCWLFIYNRIVMKTLNEDLKSGQFKQVYLLCGEEGYLKKQYKNRFVKAMIPEGDTMNYSYYEGKNTPVKEAIDFAETLPFFAERRLIVFETVLYLRIRDFLKLRQGQIWRIILRTCQRQPVLSLWKKRLIREISSIKQ